MPDGRLALPKKGKPGTELAKSGTELAKPGTELAKLGTVIVESASVRAKVERSVLTLGQKVRGAGVAVAWGGIGEAVGQVLGFFVHVSPNGLGHACGTIMASLCTIYLARGKPITLKDCLRALAKLHADGLITRAEYHERRARCLSNHDY